MLALLVFCHSCFSPFQSDKKIETHFYRHLKRENDIQLHKVILHVMHIKLNY